MRHPATTIVLFALAWIVAGCTDDDPLPGRATGPVFEPAHPPLLDVTVRSLNDLVALERAIVYANGRYRIPRMSPRSLPSDLHRLPIETRKRLFIHAMLPAVLAENEQIRRDRLRLLEWIQRERVPTRADSTWLAGLFETYELPRRSEPTVSFVSSQLLPRVDEIPPALVLAQAAMESAWGTSRFAKSGNAYFGQWTHDPADPGIVPLGRTAGRTHRIKSYPSVGACVKDYMQNLNTHRAYRRLRRLRAAERYVNRVPNAFVLVSALNHYSARGERYVDALRDIMWHNSLARYDTAVLVSPSLALLTQFDATDIGPHPAPTGQLVWAYDADTLNTVAFVE